MAIERITTPVGTLILISYKEKLVYCNWDHPQCEPKLKKAKLNIYPFSLSGGKDSQIISKVKEELNDYFAGRRTLFSICPDITACTPFQRKVLRELLNIPYGETRTYKEIAASIGNEKAVRAVAQACGANPIALIIPCHRVVGSNGNQGGYTGGIEKKSRLLELEKR